MDVSIQKFVRGLGLGDKESRVYLALLEIGKSTVSDIAKKAEIKRAITYHVLDDLIVQGYAQEILGEKVKKFSAADPLKIFQNAKSALEDFKFMLPVIRGLQSKKGNVPKIEFYDTPRAVLSVYRMFDEVPSARFLSSIDHVSSIFPQELKKWLRGYKDGSIPVTGKFLLSNTEKDKEWGSEAARYGQRVRILPEEVNIEMDFSITNNMLAITSFDPLFVVVIRSESIARSAAQLFDLAWLSGKEII